jgi:hypothetical protein
MKRLVAFAFVAMLAVSMTGCGGMKGEDVMKDTINITNELAAALEKKEPADKIKAIADKMKAVADKAKDLKLTKDEEEALKKKYEGDMKAAQERMMKAFSGLMNDPAYAAQLGGAVPGLGKP